MHREHKMTQQQSRSTGKWRKKSVFFLALFGAIIPFWQFWYMKKDIMLRRKDTLASMCDEHARMLQDQFKETFEDYTERTSFERALTSGVSYAMRVRHTEREHIERQYGWAIKKMDTEDQTENFSTSPIRDEYAPVIFSLKTASHIVSVDLMSGKEDRENILRARASGKGALTSPFKLLKSNHLGVVLTFAVYDIYLPPDATPAERINATVGYLGASYDGPSLVEKLLHKLASKQTINVNIYDTTSLDTPIKMYGADMADNGLVHISHLDFGDPARKHEMHCRFKHEPPPPWQAISASVGVLVITLLLGHIFHAAIKQIAKVEHDYREMMELKHRAEAADVAKSQFLATVSHEIRTPMNGALGMLEMLRDTNSDVWQLDYLQTAYDSGKVLISLKNKVLDQAKIESGRLELGSLLFYPRAVHDKARSIFSGKPHDRGIEFEVESDPAEVRQEEETEKKKSKTVVERYWDWELTNETQTIWLRNTNEVTTEEYNEFYKKTFNECLEPLASSHFKTEGEVEFRSILYVPSIAATGKDDTVNPKTKNIRLYVKCVFISDDFDDELFPRYLSFIKGIVDSNDFPLNVSREILQESRIVRIMRKRLVRKAFDMILGISMSEDREDYEKFWENFGKNMKLGCIEDRENHKRIAPLLRFFSSQSEEDIISLDEYVASMKTGQKDIYYIAADSVASARNTPFLEKLTEMNIEVLFLVDPIDEVAIQNLKSYKENFFVDISKEDLELGDKNEEKEKEVKQEFGQTCDWIKKRLGDRVASVQVSNRLSTSPCVLASGKFGWSANMERLMKAQTVGDPSSLEFMESRRIFETNPDHSIIRTLNAASKNSPNDEEALRAVDLLYDTALISSGFTSESPAQLGGKIYEMMNVALLGKWGGAASTGDGFQQQQVHVPETIEAEVVEPPGQQVGGRN